MDMQTLYKLKLKYQFLVVGFISFFLVSCGSHGDNSYSDTDGIYNTPQESAPSQEVASTEKDTYYKAYFKSKENTYSEMPEEDLIFTDIEAYSTRESMDEEGFIVVDDYEEEGYAGWGQNGGEVSVNFYTGVGFYGGYYGGYWGYGYPYWGIGYAWWNPFCYGGYYGYYPYHYPYYGGYYGGYYGNVSYNRGRRNSDYYNGRSSAPGRIAQSSGRDSYSRSGQYSRNNVRQASRSSSIGRSYSRSRANGRNVRSYNGQRSYSRSRNNVGGSNSRYRSSYNSRSPYSRSPYNSRSSTQRSRSNVGRSSSSRSSGSYRSSGGGSRSSGSRGGGGRSGGGRGGRG